MTTNIKVKLSASGISEAIAQLEAYKKRVSELETELPVALGKSAKEVADSRSSVAVAVSVAVRNGGADVYAKGVGMYHHCPSRVNGTDYYVSPATLEEFGFGITGKGTYPVAVPLAWVYDKSNHGEKGWFYRNGDTLMRSTGEPARAYMRAAAEDVRTNVAAKARELMNR